MWRSFEMKACKPRKKVAILAIAVGLVGCNSASQTTNSAVTNTATNKDLPQVIATTNILCDLTEQIAANTINLTCLVPPGTDPHLYQPKP